MGLKDKAKGRIAAWAITAFTDEKYWMRRKLLIPVIRKKIDEWCESKEETKMAETNPQETPAQPAAIPKPWYKSKAKIAGILMALIPAVEQISAVLGQPITIPQWVIEALIGLGIYGVRDSIKEAK